MVEQRSYEATEAKMVPGAGIECYVARYLRKPQQNHHFEEAPYPQALQKLECMLPFLPELGCHIVHGHYFRKSRRIRHL